MTRRVHSVLFLPAFLLVAAMAGAEQDAPSDDEEDKRVYRKFHPDGVVEFSDQPSRGAERLKLEQLPTYKFTPAQPASKPATTPSRQDAATGKAAAPIYNSLSINKPSRNETIRSNIGHIEVDYSLNPSLQFYKGHKLEYLLNGKRVMQVEKPTPLTNVDRGTHTLVIQVIDKEGRVLIHSDSVTFHVIRYFKPKQAAP